MSNINTNSIDNNYPVPGVNNSTQGFRDNFTSIKQNLTIAGTEISDIQSKAVVKSALTGTVLNNDMANTLISNASVQGFRAKTYNIGDIQTGSIVIDVTKADVQYGTISATGTVPIAFGGWAPAGTQSNVQIRLSVNPNIANTNTYLSFPTTTVNTSGNITLGMSATARILDNYGSNVTDANAFSNIGNTVVYQNFISLRGLKEVDLNISTIDCGTILDVTPINLNQRSDQIPIGTTTSVGSAGDWPGKIKTDGTYLYVCVGYYDGSTPIWKKASLSWV